MSGYKKSKTLSVLLHERQTWSSKYTASHMDMTRKTKYNIASCSQMIRHGNKCGNCNLLNSYARALKWSLNPQNNEPCKYFLLEHSDDISPMVVDTDLKEKTESSTALYTDDQVLRLAREFQRVIESSLFENNYLNFDSYVLQKPGYLTTDNQMRNGSKMDFTYTFHMCG